MIAAGTGLAVGGAADNAALEASLEAIERSGAARADLALVFVTGDAHSRAHEALHAVRRVTGAPVVVGCSGTGILTERREVEDELAVAVLAVRCERLVATPFSFERQGERRELGAELARRIGPTVAEGGCALVLPDAIGCNPTALLTEAIRANPDIEARIRRAGVFAGLAMDPAKSPLERGDFLVRNLVGADQSSGALAVAERVRVGQTLQFQIRDAQASREDLREMLDELAERLDGRRPAFGCYFDCAGRGRGLFGVPDHDVTLIRERLGEFPLLGFFGNGEFAPIGRRNFFHNYTGALVIFPEA